VLRETAADPLDAFRIPNVLGTARLARSCVQLGVRRLVYVSSVKVNGEATAGRAFTEADPAAPEDAYGASKAEAERVLREIAHGARLELVVVRPCLIYGPGVGGNLRTLLWAVAKGIPLPFGAVRNRRSLLGLDNACDLLARCVRHPAAAGETFLAADGPDVSTPELARALAAGLGRAARLWPVPPGVLEAAARLSGHAPALRKLCGSLRVDISKARAVIGWSPPLPTEIGLRRTGEWYRAEQGSTLRAT
jgi:nucleoside-diphosphate-sugar epimerase